MAAQVVVSFEGAIVEEVELSRPVTVVGRHPDCDIVIDHPAVSLRHALFRVVNRTVYVEDLASTNGTRVNAITASNQVIHHLDVVQVGEHKLHFFQDSLLSGGVGDLERTVLNDAERTMLVAHLSADPVEMPAVVRAQVSDDGLDRTMAIAAAPEMALAAAAPGSAPDGRLALRAATGERAGEVTVLDRANTMIGTPGGNTALVVRRGRGFFLARLGGRGEIRLNGRDLSPGTHAISEHDWIEVGGTSFDVIATGDPGPPGPLS